ncbi:Complement receptor type 2 [Dissostichus eleginoides]|uniref:Complement receptor type 2 n=1 Tax=Dissostichus eleginoides TaxID=100907 RepID=A0AAD9CKU6_DISEL|nr:Complement receptor type 2 [Dissostichus eleginoides]
MTACSFFIIFTIYLTFIFHPSHGFEVIQPQNLTVNLSATISCEHNANVKSVKDVRLNTISQTDKSTMLCQKGMKECKDIIMLQKNPNKWLFILLNIEPEAMKMKYECEFTVEERGLDKTKSGDATILLPGQKEVTCAPQPQPPSPPSPPSHLLSWILIGLLALMFLYSCLITAFYIRLTCSDTDPENSTYVEMRKAPRPCSPVDIYCG